MKKVLVVIGTRPEAIKMAPVIKEMQAQPDFFNVHVCITAQHREMLDQVLDFFNIVPDSDLDLMQPNQSLAALSSRILIGVTGILKEFNPHMTLVHGDTTTAMMSALASFYEQVPVVHVEAGLRTYAIASPFPEEANRQLISRIASLHMAPTQTAQQCLIDEQIPSDTIHITGNTVIDALHLGLDLLAQKPSQKLLEFKSQLPAGKILLVTGHRRENHGDGILAICEALKKLAIMHPECAILYPVHLNPKIQQPVNALLHNISNVVLVAPLDYELFIYAMQHSYFIITDSGGIQEEAPSLGKPVLVMRDHTERQEAVDAGAVILVGNDKDQIVSEAHKLLTNQEHYDRMSHATNPYGNGTAASQIVDRLKQFN